MKQNKGPEFIRFFRPIIQVMRNLGGSGTAAEIVDRSLEVAQITEAEQQAVNKNGLSRVKNQFTGRVSISSGLGILDHRSGGSGISRIKGCPWTFQRSMHSTYSSPF